jgi:hypothetical protein
MNPMRRWFRRIKSTSVHRKILRGEFDRDLVCKSDRRGGDDLGKGGHGTTLAKTPELSEPGEMELLVLETSSRTMVR